MRVLRNRSLLLLGAAEIVNNLGSWITAMALAAILIFQRHGSIAQSTGIFLVGLAPMLLLSPLAGWVCDRVDRRRLMVISRLLEGAFTAGLIFTDSLPVIYGLLLLAAICSTVMSPARSTTLPDLVPPEQLTQANAFMQQITGIVKVLAPMAAGAVLAVLPPHTAIILDVVSFLLSAGVLLLLPPLPPRSRAADPQQAGDRVNVLSILRDVPGLSIMLPVSFLIMMVMIAFDVSASVYVRDVLHGSVSFTGIIVGVIGAGTIGGSSLLMWCKGPRNAWGDIVVGLLLLAVVPGALAAGALGLASAIGRPLVIFACLAGGFGIGVVNVQVDTLLQRNSPPGWLGQIGGVMQSVAVAGQLVGMLLTPLLVPDVVSFGVYFGASTVLMLLTIAVTAAGLVRLGARPPEVTEEHG